MRLFDHYAALAREFDRPRVHPGASALASGLVDGCTQWIASADLLDNPRDKERRKSDARRCYQERSVALGPLTLPVDLNFSKTVVGLLHGWIAIEVQFSLLTPWYSKDHRSFHVLDNPVRKDRVFGVPFMSAASWKGLLRWACCMEHLWLEHLAAHDGQMRDWDKRDYWIVHLFGNARPDGEEFSRGVLHCYPTWFDKVSFEVINPHDRARRAGTKPITYEVVPRGTAGTLRLLYAPLPNATGGVQARMRSIEMLLDATEKLLTVYGFSAKRTAGWGISEIEHCTVRCRDREPIDGPDIGTVKSRLNELFSPAEGAG